MSPTFPSSLDQFATAVDHVTVVAASDRNNVQNSILSLEQYSRPAYNVRTFGGAVGNGSTDDSTAIQNTINAANAAGGGTVYFPAGTYVASGLIFFGKIRYLGEGIENTILKLKSGANTYLLQSFNFASLTLGNSVAGEFNFTLEQLTLDGNKAGNASATVPVIRIYGYGYIIDNVRIRNGNNEGLYSEWSSSAPSPGADAMEAHVSGLKVHDNGGAGIHWNGPHDSNFVNCESYSNGAIGINVDLNGNGVTFTNTHSWGLSQTYAYYLNVAGCSLTNCVAEGASVAQIVVNANDCSLSGVFIFAAGGGTIGLLIGDTVSVTGTTAMVKVNNCNTAAVKFNNDAQSYVLADVFQTSGSPTAGTISALSYVHVLANGVGGSVYQFPNQVDIKSGNGLRLFNSTNASWATLSFDGSKVNNTWPWQQAAGQYLASGAGVRPGTSASAVQSNNIFFDSGIPSNTNGSNNDWSFSDNGHVYFKAGGSWAQKV